MPAVIPPGVNPQMEERTRPGLRSINWSKFDTALRVDLGMVTNFEEKPLTQKIEILTSILDRAEIESAPIRRRSRLTPRWWNKELDILRAAKIRSERKLQRIRKRLGPEHEACQAARSVFVRDRTRYVNSIRFYKKKAWLECVRISSEEDPWGAAYKIHFKNSK